MIEKAGAGKPAPVFFYTVSAFALILSIGDLFDDIQRIDKATCGKNIPQAVNSIFQFAGNHGKPLFFAVFFIILNFWEDGKKITGQIGQRGIPSSKKRTAERTKGSACCNLHFYVV